MPTVALGSDFLDAYARIPRAQQRKVREFTEKFKANPKSPGINYEKIHDVRDDKVRTVRIDQKYRAVVLHPGQGDVYILAWVDNHDEAMAWARNRVFEINPVTGALQIINVSEAEQVVPPKTDKKKTPRPAASVRGRSAALFWPSGHLASSSSGRAHRRRTPRREQALAR